VLLASLNLDVSGEAAVLANQLDSLNNTVADIAATVPPANRKLVTGHESMGYFAARYGFKLVGVIIPSLSSQADVSAASLAALKQAMTDNQVKAIFIELGTSAAAAKIIGNETGVKTVELTTHTLPGDGSYFTFMKNLTGVIANALQ
jgi:zinc/manganese transport system substrate-binding protein